MHSSQLVRGSLPRTKDPLRRVFVIGVRCELSVRRLKRHDASMTKNGELSLKERLEEECDSSSDLWNPPPPSQVRQWLNNYWTIALVLLGVAALILSDWMAATNAFWASHPITASLITGGILALAVVFGVDRALKVRSRSRWRAIGTMLARRISNFGVADELLTALCEEFCEQEYGSTEYPPGSNYFTMLPHVLARVETWAPDAFGAYVFERIGQEREELERTLADWGPVLISDSEFAELGAAAQELLNATGRIHGVMDLGRPHGDEVLPIQDWWASGGKGASYLVDALLLHRDASRRIWRIASEYRD